MNTPGKSTTWLTSVAIALLVVLPTAAPLLAASAASKDLQLLQGLRDRRQYEQAEKYCAEQLRDARLSDARRLELTLELSRTLAQHAVDSPAAEQGALWKRSRDVLVEFEAANARHPRLVLLRVQSGLTAVAQGESARENAELAGDAGKRTDEARALLRGAITQLRKLDESLGAEIQLRGRTPRVAEPDQLSTAELNSLRSHVRYQLARALRNQSLCFAAGSADRTNALMQAVELLSELARQDFESPLAWSSRLDEITCLRLLERYAVAEKKLAELEKAASPAQTVGKLRAERIRLALARGQIDEALSEAGPNSMRGEAAGPDASYAQLEAYLRGWQRARESHATSEAAEWEKTAIDQVRRIERNYGPLWMRKAETLLARSVLKSAGSESPEALVRVAQSLYRSGQADEALMIYDQAEKRARDKVDKTQAFDIAYTAATIEKDQQHFRSAIDRYRKLSIANRGEDRSGEAHLLAVHCAAQLAQQGKPPKLEEYEKLLREHIATWPKDPTVSQAWWWLGRLKEHQGAWQEAARALRNVQLDHPQYVAAIEASGRCSEVMLEQLRKAGNANVPLARDTIRFFEQIIGPRAQQVKPWSPAARAAGTAAATIWLKEVPGGAAQAEDILKSALGGAGDASPEWKVNARRLLVCAVAAQGRTADAEQLLEQTPIGTAAESLAMIEMLAELVDGALPDRKPKLAPLALTATDDLLARRDELDAATIQKLSRVQASMLLAAGRPQDAIETYKALAKANPRDGQVQEDVAAALSAMGDPAGLQAALVAWREVVGKSRPGSPRWFRANYSLALTQLTLGDRGEARATISRLESSHPELGGAEMKARFVQLAAECELPPPARRGTQKK